MPIECKVYYCNDAVAGSASSTQTIDALTFIKQTRDHTTQFRFKVIPIPRRFHANAKVADALKQLNIADLPAIRIGAHSFAGLSAIRAALSPPSKPPPAAKTAASTGDALRDFYESELASDDNGEEDYIGDAPYQVGGGPDKKRSKKTSKSAPSRKSQPPGIGQGMGHGITDDDDDGDYELDPKDDIMEAARAANSDYYY